MSNAKALTPIPATLIPGDGIGPEITEAVLSVLDALGAPFEWDRQQGGMAAIKEGGDPLPASLLDSIRRTKLALKGPLTTPVGGGFRSVNVRLREEFGLYANLRPAKTMVPGGRYEDIDIVLVRENLEGTLCRLRALHRSRRRPEGSRNIVRHQYASRGTTASYGLRSSMRFAMAVKKSPWFIKLTY